MRDKKYDLIHSYTELVIFSYLSRRSFIANPTGSDLRELAFSKSIRGILLRRAYNKAKVVIAHSPEVLELLSKLKVQKRIFLPVLMDFSFFQPSDDEKKSDDLVVFHPSNLDWKTKGNDKIVQGFSKFVTDHPKSSLIIIDRGIDSKKTHDLVRKLDLNDKIQFIKGPLDFSELIKYYHKSDVVADQFIIGEFGGIGRETLCIGKPLLGSYHVEKYEKIFGRAPPLINVKTPEEISKQLQFLTDYSFRNKIGQKGREWAIEYHSPNVIVKKLKIIYESVLNDEKTSSIRQKLV
jgi:glycosyltransferase involved in cell wall biosynthesis